MNHFLRTSILFLSLVVVLSAVCVTPGLAQKGNKGGKGKPDSKDADTWSAEEYSGLRGEKDLRSAMASKGFAWLSGSPADNEKLSVGKNAQFFGFVALRYQSGRAANRGTLGRAVYSIANKEQQTVFAEAVVREQTPLNQWWEVREEILTLLEDHLYTGLPIDREKITSLGERFSLLNSEVAISEATAFAAFEDSLSMEQETLLSGWRANAESAGEYGKNIKVEAANVDRELHKQLEDLYAKAFSWLTGKPEDNEIIPIGQPAQFFGFVSIRHKSGHAASRGTISKSFMGLLGAEQGDVIARAVKSQVPIVREFLENRHEFLSQLGMLRSDPSLFDRDFVDRLSREMGRLEIEAACIEAEAYRKIRVSMSEEQVAGLMELRGDYIVDDSQIATLDMAERGAALSILCSGCHGAPGMHRVGFPAPTLDGFWDRKIASGADYEYSSALSQFAQKETGKWTPQLLDQFLASPKKFAPGTKMEFQGLLNEEDRTALIAHLKTSR